MQELLNNDTSGYLQFGGARMALFDVEAGFWGLRRQLEALVGPRLTNFVFQQAGANGGHSFAHAFTTEATEDTAVSLFKACLNAYQLAGFGRFTLTDSQWPLGHLHVKASDTFESWMWAQHQQTSEHPICAYSAGVMVGFINAVSHRRDIVCVEHTCQARGDDACTFELLPRAEAGDTAVVSFDPDPFLSQQLNLLDILFDRMPMGIAIFDRDLKIRRVNPTWAGFIDKYTLASASDVLPGIHFFDLLPDLHDDFQPIFDRVLAGETVKASALPSTSGDTTSYWDVVFSPLVDNGQVIGILDVVIDATDRQKMLAQLRQSDAHLRSLLESASGYAVYRVAVDPNKPFQGEVVLVSPSIRDVVGIEDPTDFANWFADIHPDDADRIIAANRRAMEDGIPFDETMRFFNPRRQAWRWVHTVSRPVFDSNGRLTHFNGIVIDVTDQKEAEAALAQLNETLEQKVVERTRELSTLLEVSQNVASTLELEPLLGLVLDQLRSVVDYDGASIFELQQNELRLIAYRGPIPAHSALRLIFPLDEAGANQTVITEKKPAIIGNIYDETPMARAFRATAGDELETTFAYLRSWMGVPLILRGRVLGMISLDHGRPNFYNDQSARLAQAFASQVAVFIENARLYEQEQERRRIAESLRDVLIMLNTDAPMSKTLQDVLQQACTLLGADAAILSSLDSEKDRILLEASHGLPPEMASTTSLPFIDSPPNQATLAGRPFVVPHIADNLAQRKDELDALPTEPQRWLRQIEAHFGAYLSVPLLIKETIYGDITLYYQKAHPFDEELINLAETFGSQTALAIENARLYRLEQSRRQVAESLRDILARLNSTRPLQEVMDYIASQASRLLGPDSAVAIFHIDPLRQEAILEAQHGLPQTLAAVGTLPLAVIGVDLYTKRTPLVVPNVDQWPPLNEPNVDLPDHARRALDTMRQTYRSYLAVPLIVQNEVFGGMAFHYPKQRVFSNEDVDLAQTLANQVALAIENARHYEQEQERRRVAEGLYDVLQLINAAMLLPDALDAIVRQAAELMRADVGVLHRIDYDDEFVTIEASSNLPAELADITGFALLSSPGDLRILKGKPVYSNRNPERARPKLPEDAARWPADVRRWRLTMGTAYPAFFAAPLMVQDEVYGSLAFYFQQPQPFDDDMIGLAMSLARQAGLAIENARLRQQTEQMAVISERNRLARELHDAVTQTLFSASLIADVLPRLWEKDPDMAQDRLADLRELTRGALAEMRTLLLELRPATLTESSLGELLQQLTAATIGRARLPVELTIENERPLSPDIQIVLYRIAQEALNNISKHAQATAVNMTLTFTNNRVELTVADNGRGFDVETVGVQSLGLGIMRERAEKIGAELDIDSKPDAGTTVHVHTTI